MLEVGLDLRPAADAPHGGHQPKGLIWLDHDSSLRPAKPVRHPALFPCSTWPSRILSVPRAAPLLPSPHRHRDTGAHRAGPGSRGRGRSHTGRQGSHMSILGTRVMRTEDPRLLTFGGTYVDDLRVPELAGASRITFVRSPLAHALISGIDVSPARSAPGVVAALTAADLNNLPPPPPDDGSGGNEAAPLPLGGPWAEPLLAVDRVRYVGEQRLRPRTAQRQRGSLTGQRGLRAAAGGRGRRRGAGWRDAAVPRGRVKRPGHWWRASRRLGLRWLRRRAAADHREPAARTGPAGRARRRCQVGRRQADRLGEHSERADLPVRAGRRGRA